MVAVILAKPELGESSDVCAGGAVGEDMRNCIVWRGTELGSRMELGGLQYALRDARSHRMCGVGLTGCVE